MDYKTFEEKIKQRALKNAKDKSFVKNLLGNEVDFLKKLHNYSSMYNKLLSNMNVIDTIGEYNKSNSELEGVIALNGASGVGQSYVMKYIRDELDSNNIDFERIYLLGMRDKREGEGYKDPYIFVNKEDDKFICRDKGKVYTRDDIYFEYESRPNASNVILKKDIKKADNQLMYLETVIPTLLKMKYESLSGLSPLEDKLNVVYLTAESGEEWLTRLAAREPDQISDESYKNKLIGRIKSSLDDMKIVSDEKIPSVVNEYMKGKETAKKALTAWGIYK